jgi:hypothetical protein
MTCAALIRPVPAVLDQRPARVIPPPDSLHDLGLAPSTLWSLAAKASYAPPDTARALLEAELMIKDEVEADRGAEGQCLSSLCKGLDDDEVRLDSGLRPPTE